MGEGVREGKNEELGEKEKLRENRRSRSIHLMLSCVWQYQQEFRC